MLYNLACLERTLSEAAGVLRPRGNRYAATNGAAHMRQLHDIIRRSIPGLDVVCGSFTFENGHAILERHFHEVSVGRCEDNLVVPDADALSAYVRSMASLADATSHRLDEIGRESVARSSSRVRCGRRKMPVFPLREPRRKPKEAIERQVTAHAFCAHASHSPVASN